MSTWGHRQVLTTVYGVWKNDRLGASALHPLVLGCLRMRDVWPWEEVTIFEPTVMGTVSELPNALMKELSNEVKGFSTSLPTLFFLAALFLTLIFLYLFFRLCLLKAYSSDTLGGYFAEQRSRAGFWAERMKEP